MCTEFSVERHKFMIKDEKQRTTRTRNRGNHSMRGIPDTRLIRARYRFFSKGSGPLRQGTSQHVLDIADHMIEEYKSDLDYLKDK